MRDLLSGVMAALLVAGSASAGIIVSAVGSPSTDLAGYTTYTVNAASDQGAIRGFSATFNGNFNHVMPIGMATPLGDLNGFFTVPVDNDTQFMFTSSGLSVPPIGAAETATSLTASISGLAGLNVANAIDIAQIVVPDGETFSFDIDFDETGTPDAVNVAGMLPGGGLEGDPEAGDISGLLQGAFDDRNFGPVLYGVMMMGDEVGSIDANGVEVIDKGDGKYDLLVGPADGDFSGYAPGTVLSGDVTFVGATSGEVRYDFSISVPEPSTVALSSLALLGLVGFARRRNG